MPDNIQYNKGLVERIFESKRQYHSKLAKLPIEEKIRILVELQKIALNIQKAGNRNENLRVWQITEGQK